ncbi:unnamed protein product [Dovyalis caffra]|uniref:Ubiquitin-like domain-containing protein n=1 Tax=Dovyalis caffra TaxID=77055 RepID=A0AAV1SI59_9ROSI|nr:unnamed protein product [Dovyalis caffra]
MKVNIDFEGVNRQLIVRDDATVLDLKMKVQETFGFLATNQKLFINGSAMVDDYSKLVSYGMVDGANISFRFKILIQGQPNQFGNSKEYELFVDGSNTVLNLKQMLNSEYGIDIRTIKFKMDNNDNLDDNTKIWNYNIKPGSYLHMI